MDVMMLPKKQKMFNCEYAAPSVLTKKFVANILDATEQEILEMLTDPGDIVVYNKDTGSHTYRGYTTVEEIREQPIGHIAILTHGEQKSGSEPADEK